MDFSKQKVHQWRGYTIAFNNGTRTLSLVLKVFSVSQILILHQLAFQMSTGVAITRSVAVFTPVMILSWVRSHSFIFLIRPLVTNCFSLFRLWRYYRIQQLWDSMYAQFFKATITPKRFDFKSNKFIPKWMIFLLNKSSVI